MKIGYLHRDNLPLSRGESVQSWQIASRIARKHQLLGGEFSHFPFVKKLYQGKKTLWKFLMEIDVLFTIVDGYVDFYHEKFTPIAKLFGIPTVWLLNSPIEECYSFDHTKWSFLKHRLFRLFTARYVDHAICISKEMEQYARKVLGIKNTTVISNGADVNIFSPSVKKALLLDRPDLYKIIWSGNGEFSWQALDTILKLADYFKTKDEKVIFVVISNLMWVKRSIPSNVFFFNAVDINTLPQYLNAADICLCLYHSQKGIGFYRSPMKLFDYMSMQKPIIASNLGQINEIIKEGQNGLLVGKSVSEIADKIMVLKNNPIYAKKLAAKARQDVVKIHNWDQVAESMSSVITQLVELKRSR